ncbi:hypothetical protein A3I36_02145 [Candidatus Giovannonibacteria bacterium RIFCSPLOWO2_02_FULL_45_28]|uniref:Alpha amylase family protein n=3 Tax=Parcubacteria group TaxID=1794811 RepID=A0A837IJ93_9BACT|nr:MAG: Alpha amylase family protein [Candidatus Giovannonibacteria bacterium GW2011_GWA1_44_25]KKU12105.1 MAG: Alpha amylase family protein [Candidatus Azambacteria bacterium GW2011_GWC2_45_7b]KKU28920.1 MAG: Alpha amylase family protein [Candidatus Giovannonibacteria bacterium GW2011_GWB1_46_20]OGF50028.1 MAG: hypothetical protein A2120_02790 [Candidatus Giovannonibacteria bacterium GWA2_45_15]OGF59349.1 MAG: hypothetical protein A2W40_04175 [Candidatus Giovannonibacteria bacterium RIFCSPHIGH
MWWKNAVIYELYVDKFAENFAGLSEKLGYLKSLGINCVHILPHYPSPMVDDGYDVSDYKSVRAELGTIEDFEKFTKSAHGLGIKIIVDLVLNHASINHPLFIEASRDKNALSRNLFLWSDTGKEYASAINSFPHLKPKNWIYNKITRDYYFSTFYPEQADFNWANPKVLVFFLDVMEFWVSRGADGFRLDAVSHLVKKEGTNSKGLPVVHEILKQLRTHIDKNFPDVILLAEVHDDISKMKSYFGAGDECHLVYNFYLNERMWLALKRDDKSTFEKALAASASMPGNSAWANFLRSYDEISMSTLEPSEVNEVADYFDPAKKFRFRSYIAMRQGSMFKGDKEKTLEAFGWLFEAPGAHVIYYGDEIGLENADILAGEDARKTVRGYFDWPRAEKEMRNKASLWNSLKDLISVSAVK